ncbi:MAG: hypothetical protein R3B70_29390 [Polyangiaceae bacterium]
MTVRPARRPEDYRAAADIYEAVLRQGEGAVGRRAWAYAKHYLHYNRYKSKRDLVEPLSATEAGYRESIERWPENGLFWSRLALTQFLRGERALALATLQEARERVPEHTAAHHTGKEWLLRARVVQRLLGYEPPRVVDALLVWGSHVPVDLRERNIDGQLTDALERGWRTALLDVPGERPVFLHREITVTICRAGKKHVCALGDLSVSGRAGDPMQAYVEAIRKLRSQVDELRRAPTHTLDPDARTHKQRLLSGVDIVASGLLGSVPEATWILGKLEVEGETLRVREVGSRACAFDLDPSVDRPLLTDSHVRLVRVRTGAAGEPLGPALEIGPPLAADPARLWEEWRQRMHEADRG